MSYIDLVNRFWLLDSQEPFSPVETRLYFFLLNMANRSGWGNPFPVSNPALAMSLGCSANTMDKARRQLLARGLLNIEAGGCNGRRTTRYTIPEPPPRKRTNRSEKLSVNRSTKHSEIHSKIHSNFEAFEEKVAEKVSPKVSNFTPLAHIDIDSSYKTKDIKTSLSQRECVREGFFDECCDYFLAPERREFQESQQRLFGITDLAGAFRKFHDILVSEDLTGQIRSHQDFARLFKYKYCIPLQRKNETATGNNGPADKAARDASFRAHILDKLTHGGSG